MRLNNKYYLLRHGEASSNVRGVISSWPETFKNPLTEKGVKQIQEAIEKLKDKSIDMIFSSDLLRAEQTAQMVGEALKIVPEFDTRLREIGAGSFNGKTLIEWDNYFNGEAKTINNSVPGGETYSQVLARAFDFLEDIDKKYNGKQVLIVSHQCPLWLLQDKVAGLSLKEALRQHPEEKRMGRGELRELN